MHYTYPVDVLEADDDATITAPDVPELVTCGDTRDEALGRAEDALMTALGFYIDDGRALPVPGPAMGRPPVAVPSLVAAKLALYDAMLTAGLSNLELGRRLGIDEKAARRLRDPLHRSHIEAVEAVPRSLGKQIELAVRDAA